MQFIVNFMFLWLIIGIAGAIVFINLQVKRMKSFMKAGINFDIEQAANSALSGLAPILFVGLITGVCFLFFVIAVVYRIAH